MIDGSDPERFYHRRQPSDP